MFIDFEMSLLGEIQPPTSTHPPRENSGTLLRKTEMLIHGDDGGGLESNQSARASPNGDLNFSPFSWGFKDGHSFFVVEIWSHFLLKDGHIFPFNFFQRLLCCFKEWSQFLERRSLFVFIVGESQVEKGNFLNLSLTSLSITFLLTIHKVSISILSDSNS